MAYNRELLISFYSGVPIDAENTLYYGAGRGQDEFKAWFDANYFVHEVTDTAQTYQREDVPYRLALRAPATGSGYTGVDLELIYPCNWMIYKNPLHENRWFFCRITAINYVNDGMALIQFEVDPWLTWCDRITLGEGHTIRNHYVNELDPTTLTAQKIEQVYTGEPVSCYHYDYILNNPSFLVTYATDIDGQAFDETYFLPSGSTLPSLRYSVVGMEGLNQIIYDYMNIGRADAIQSITAVPTRPFEYQVTLPVNPPIGNTRPWTKLYKYPLMYIRVNNGMGDEKIYYMEQFVGTDGKRIAPKFEMIMLTESGVPVLAVVPHNYKGLALNWEEALYLDKFPQLQWINDPYAQWAAVNSNREAFKGLATVIGALAAAPSTGGASVGAGAGAIGLQMANADAIAKQTDKLMGSPTYGGGVQHSLGRAGIHFDVMRGINSVLDVANQFFNAYGYESGSIAPPNLDLNPFFNYVKGDYSVRGVSRQKVQDAIKQMFINGCRLWHQGAIFGDFNVDNRA